MTTLTLTGTTSKNKKTINCLVDGLLNYSNRSDYATKAATIPAVTPALLSCSNPLRVRT
jgi:hypothetical protein